MFSYARKRVSRSWKLFAALFVSVVLASTLFASVNFAADITARETLDQALEGVPIDITVESTSSTLSLENLTTLKEELIDSSPNIRDIEIISLIDFSLGVGFEANFTVVGIEGDFNSSMVMKDSQFISGTTVLGANQTYIDVRSADRSKYALNDTIPLTIVVGFTPPTLPILIPLNLSVAGFLEVTDDAVDTIIPEQVLRIMGITIPLGRPEKFNILVVNWTSTFETIIDYIGDLDDPLYTSLTHKAQMNIDRAAIIDPYDIEGSNNRLTNLLIPIAEIAFIYNMHVINNLEGPMQTFDITSQAMTAQFLIIALPIFFMAWYTGTTISDVTFNLRRREIGLLQTRGFRNRPIVEILILEAAMLGAIAGILGTILGLVLTPIIIATPGIAFTQFFSANLSSIFVVVIFAIVISVFSVFSPARRAAKLETVDALKQYVYVEETSRFKKILPYTALILGSIKILMWIVGIDTATLLLSVGFSNIFLTVVISIFTLFDLLILNYLGPILFLYGFTKVLIRGSFWFQEFVIKAGGKILGEFGKLATKNVRRNPARNAAMVFVIALIVAFGVSTVGTLSSTQDLNYRRIQMNVGADVNAAIAAPENVSTLLPLIDQISGVEAVTAEYQFEVLTSQGSTELRAIDPLTWRNGAFYEDTWFIGGTLSSMMQRLQTSNRTIILSQSLADYFDLRINDSILIQLEDETQIELIVVGFFGPKATIIEITVGTSIIAGSLYWSYVPEGFYSEVANRTVSTSKILVNVGDNVNGTLIAAEIEALDPSILSTSSVDENWKDYNENIVASGSNRVQLIGVVFAGVLAMLGTGLIIYTVLKEKRIEIAIMGVRGLTPGQTRRVLYAETLTLVLFSIILGVLVGLIQVYGNTAALTVQMNALVAPRIVFPLEFILSIITIIAMVLSSVLVPVYFASRHVEEHVDLLR